MTTLAWVFCSISLLLGWLAFGLFWILGSSICRTTRWYDNIIAAPVIAITAVVLFVGDILEKRFK